MKGTTVFWEHESPAFLAVLLPLTPVVVLQAAVSSIRSASGAAGHGGQGKMKARITPRVVAKPDPRASNGPDHLGFV